MRIVNAVDIQAVVSMADARHAVHDAFCAFADGKVIAPDEMAMKLDHGGELHVKGAYLGGDVIAFKAATGGFPGGGNSGFTSVIDAQSGAPVAILQDGGWLTEMRTAAASAVTAVALARPESSRLAILGGGFQAAFQVEALRDAFDIDSVMVWSRTAETAARFAGENHATAAGSVAEAVSEADIVICCTPSREPLLTVDMVKPGTHIVAMGSDMTGKHEVAGDLVRAADVLVCDSVDVTRRVGELQHVPDQAERAVNLGEVLTARASGRTTDSQITVADLCGLGIQDAAMAQLVMSRL
jgi:ornithine cyclodeaminase